jgi:RNA polymerase sigma-70 factor (ECF subfamily)
MTTLIRPSTRRETDAVELPPTRTDPDADLIEMLRDGSNEAAEALTDRFGPRAYRLALRITGNALDAEEATQDALWRVLGKIQTFRGQSAFRSWVYRITANAAYEMLRHRHRKRHEVSWEELSPRFDELGRHAAPITDWSPRVDDPAIQSELRAALTQAIEHLPPDYRTVLVMRDVDGMSNAEVAGVLGMSVLAVKSRIHRARLFVREWLSRFWAPATAAEDRTVAPHAAG